MVRPCLVDGFLFVCFSVQFLPMVISGMAPFFFKASYLTLYVWIHRSSHCLHEPFSWVQLMRLEFSWKGKKRGKEAGAGRVEVPRKTVWMLRRQVCREADSKEPTRKAKMGPEKQETN